LKSIASAPAKIILFGEHFVVHGTKAILAAIDKRVTVTSTFTENKTIKVNSQLGTIEVPISTNSHEEVKSEFRPFVYLANKMINSNQNVNGLEITIDSDIPIGVGLGSSSACCVAAAASIYTIFSECLGEQLEYLTRSSHIGFAISNISSSVFSRSFILLLINNVIKRSFFHSKFTSFRITTR